MEVDLNRTNGKTPEQLLKEFKENGRLASGWKPSYSRKQLLDIASRIPCGSVRELFDNAEKIREWLER